MTTFWLDLTDAELEAVVFRQPMPNSLREKCRESLSNHYRDLFAAATTVKDQRYQKQSRRAKEAKTA